MIDDALFWEWLRKRNLERSTSIEEQPQLEIELPKRRPPNNDSSENETKIDYSIDDNVIYKL